MLSKFEIKFLMWSLIFVAIIVIITILIELGITLYFKIKLWWLKEKNIKYHFVTISVLSFMIICNLLLYIEQKKIDKFATIIVLIGSMVSYWIENGIKNKMIKNE